MQDYGFKYVSFLNILKGNELKKIVVSSIGKIIFITRYAKKYSTRQSKCVVISSCWRNLFNPFH
jgi:hypothetical protein